MPVVLGDPDRSPLASPPIILAVCQVRTEPNPRASDEQAVLGVYEALGGSTGIFPRVMPPSTQSMSPPIGGASITIQQPGWRFGSADESWTVSVLPDSFSLETFRYRSWDGDDGYFARLERVMDAIAQHLRPTIEVRLGLRYVNQITKPHVTVPEQWRTFIDDQFLGPIADPRVGPGVEGSDSRVALDLGAGHKCVLRHGSFLDAGRPGLHTYLLDADCYREAAVPWSLDVIKTTVGALNAAAVSLFQTVTTPGLRRLFDEPETNA